MATNSTTLNLLTREGAICVTFTPGLEPSQYDELHQFSEIIEYQYELEIALKEMGNRWGREVIIDPC
jgi:hypothetical protein